MRPSAQRQWQAPPAPLPAVQEECENDAIAAMAIAEERRTAEGEDGPAPSLTRQLGLPPVQRKPLHWRIVRPRGGAAAATRSLTPAAPAAGSSESSEGGSDTNGMADGRARRQQHGDGVLSTFSAAPTEAVPRQIGLTSRRHRSGSTSNGSNPDGSTVGSSSTTVSSLRSSAPSLTSDKSDNDSSSFLEAMTKKAVSFHGSAGRGGGKASTLPSHRLHAKGGGFFERAVRSESRRNRTLMVLSAAAIVGASLSALTLPSSASRGKRSSWSGAGLSRALREGGGDGGSAAGRTLMSLEARHLDRYPFTNMADTSQLVDATSEVAFYWQVPRSGGTTFKHVVGSCLDLVQASRTAKDYCDVTLDTLEVSETKFGRFVNVDPSDDAGIKRGRELGVVQSGLVDVVVSSRFLHSAGLFDSDGGKVDGGGRGRAFTVLRHPVDRSLSTFRYLQNAHWERNYNPEFKTLSVVQWSRRLDTASNWMVRWLTGKNHEADLEPADLDFAKAVLRRKFLVLLTDDLVLGVERLIRYMGWETTPEQRRCARGAAVKAAAKNKGSTIDELGGATINAEGQIVEGDAELPRGSEEYEALASINDLDIQLYEYAQELYREQWKAIFMEGKALRIRGDENDRAEDGASDAANGAGGATAVAASIAAAFESGKTANANNQAQPQNEAKKQMGEMMSTDKALAAAAGAAADKTEPSNAGDEKPAPPPPPKADRESLPLPPEMAKLAAQFEPIEDMDLDLGLDDGAEKGKKGAAGTDDEAAKGDNVQGEKNDDVKDEEVQGGSKPQESAEGQKPPQAASEEQDQQPPPAAVERSELPVPPEMARLAAAFGEAQEERKQEATSRGGERKQEVAGASYDHNDLMSSEEDSARKGYNGGAKDALPVPPDMARLAATFEN